MNAVGYTRVSTDGQATDGVSLEAQQARIRAWCEANAYALVDIHVDAGPQAAERTIVQASKKP